MNDILIKMYSGKKSNSADQIGLKILETAPSDDELSTVSPTASELLSEGLSFVQLSIPASTSQKLAAKIEDIETDGFKAYNLDTGEEFDLRESDVQSMLNRSLTLNFEQAVERELWYSASRNDHRAVKKLLKMYDADLSYLNHGMTCLHVAAFHGFHKTCEMLLDYGINVELSARGLYGQTVLHLACAVNSLTTIQLLVRSGASTDLQDINGDTPLHILA